MINIKRTTPGNGNSRKNSTEPHSRLDRSTYQENLVKKELSKILTGGGGRPSSGRNYRYGNPNKTLQDIRSKSNN